MNVPAALLALAGAGLAVLVAFELRPHPGFPEPTVAPSLASAPSGPALPALPAPPIGPPAADTLLARPLFSQTRRPAGGPGPAASPRSADPTLPRMTAILIDGPRRSAIFAASATPGGKPTVIAEGGRIGPFTVQTIEPQQVTVVGPDGTRTIRTSFDPVLQPPPPPQLFGIPQFPGIANLGSPPPILPGTAPSAGYGIPQSPGAAR